MLRLMNSPILQFPGSQKPETEKQSDKSDAEFAIAAQSWLRKYEGEPDFMYGDTVGEVTVGIGARLTRNDLPTINFKVKKNFAEATDAEKKAEWERIKQLAEKNKGKDVKASTYRNETALFLPKGEMDRLLENHLDYFQQVLKKKYTNFDGFPDDAKLGLVDMLFNLGEGRFNKFVLFNKAVQQEDWEAAAKESHRQGPSQDRNDAVKQLFENAAKRKKQMLEKKEPRTEVLDVDATLDFPGLM
jgi:GH24 family phage-related lysozyme (muramidase)